MSDPVERVRACVAEMGYDPVLVCRPAKTDTDHLYYYLVGAVPDEVMWRAHEVGEVEDPICWECFQYAYLTEQDCLASTRQEQDCGLTRNPEHRWSERSGR